MLGCTVGELGMRGSSCGPHLVLSWTAPDTARHCGLLLELWLLADLIFGLSSWFGAIPGRGDRAVYEIGWVSFGENFQKCTAPPWCAQRPYSALFHNTSQVMESWFASSRRSRPPPCIAGGARSTTYFSTSYNDTRITLIQVCE